MIISSVVAVVSAAVHAIFGLPIKLNPLLQLHFHSTTWLYIDFFCQLSFGLNFCVVETTFNGL